MALYLSSTQTIAGQVQARAEMNVKRVLNGFDGNLYANKLSIPNISVFDNLASDEKFVARQIHNWMGIMFENNFAQY